MVRHYRTESFSDFRSAQSFDAVSNGIKHRHVYESLLKPLINFNYFIDFLHLLLNLFFIIASQMYLLVFVNKQLIRKFKVKSTPGIGLSIEHLLYLIANAQIIFTSSCESQFIVGIIKIMILCKQVGELLINKHSQK